MKKERQNRKIGKFLTSSKRLWKNSNELFPHRFEQPNVSEVKQQELASDELNWFNGQRHQIGAVGEIVTELLSFAKLKEHIKIQLG